MRMTSNNLRHGTSCLNQHIPKSLLLRIDARTRTLVDAAFDLSYTYIEILQGIGAGVVPLDQPKSFLTTDVVRKIAGSAPKLISYLPKNGGKSIGQTFAALTFQRLAGCGKTRCCA